MSRRAFWWWLGALTVLAAVPRALTLTHALFGDEMFTWAIAAEPAFGDAMSLMRETENTPPLTYVVAWALAKVLDPVHAVRVLPVLCGIAMVPVAGAVGARAFGHRAGLAGAALLALSPFAVYYGGEARAYAPAALATIAAALALLMALESRRARWWVAVTVAAALAVWAHYTAVFPLAAQFAWALCAHRDRARAILLSHGAAALLYVPWLPFLTTNAGRQALAAFSPVNRDTIVEVPAKFLFGTPYLGVTNVPGRLGLWLLAVALAIGVAWLVRERPRLRPGSIGGLLVLTALATPVCALAYSLVGDSIWNPRNLIASLPAALLVAGAVLARRGAPGLIACALALGVFASATVRESTRLVRPPYDELAAFVDREADPGDPIVEHQVIVAPGPLRLHLAVWLERPHERHVMASDPGAGDAWDAGLRTGSVFVVAPVGGLPGAELPPDADPRFEPAARRVAEGLFDLQVVEYVPR